ncbi:hypothetical protein ACFE04_028660 [Oxalis oulophora]
MPHFEIIKTVKRGPVGVFLDYDGTLAAIVNDSNKAFMTTEMAATLKQVAKNYPTAVVSGRAKDKVKDFVKLENISYAGSNGATHLTFKAASKNVYDEMRKVVLKIPNTKLEENSYFVIVLYREVDDQERETVKKITEAVVQRYPSLHVDGGNMLAHNADTTYSDGGSNVKKWLVLAAPVVEVKELEDTLEKVWRLFLEFCKSLSSKKIEKTEEGRSPPQISLPVAI